MSFTVNAGIDQTANDGDLLQLTGVVTTSSYDIPTVLWTQDSGPGCAIQEPTKWSTIVLNLYAGTYVFRFTGTDSTGATQSDTVSVVVSHTTGPVYVVPYYLNTGQ